MAKPRLTGKSVFALFKALSPAQQDQFIELCRLDCDDNAVKLLFQSENDAQFDAAMAGGESLRSEMYVAHLKRKPDRDADEEAIRLREAEKLSFGQMAKQLGLNGEATARQRYNRAKRRQSQ